MATPLQPKEFFRGTWTGEGELLPNPLLRWLFRPERLLLETQAVWLSETTWIVKDRFEFSSGSVIQREMLAEWVAPERIHLLADDLPAGADILLSEDGFEFIPYYILATYRGWTYRLWCQDKCHIDAEGFVHDMIRLYFWRIPVATMQLGPIARSPAEGPQVSN